MSRGVSCTFALDACVLVAFCLHFSSWQQIMRWQPIRAYHRLCAIITRVTTAANPNILPSNSKLLLIIVLSHNFNTVGQKFEFHLLWPRPPNLPEIKCPFRRNIHRPRWKYTFTVSKAIPSFVLGHFNYVVKLLSPKGCYQCYNHI